MLKGINQVFGWRTSRSEEDGLKRDPELGRLLSQLAPQRELLAWSDVQRLVDSAPPVRVTWAASLVQSGLRPMRYALAAFVLFGFGTGVLALMPAQSDVVGTTVLTQLPAVWPVGSAEFKEVESAAQAQFKALGVPQSDMYVKVGAAAGQQQLAFAMLGFDRAQAEQFFGALAQKYPALRVVKPQYIAIDLDRAGSRLHELVLEVLKPELLRPLGEDALKGNVLRSLKQCGFDDIKINVYRGADGTTYIEVDARMKFAVTGRTQEELEASGLSEQVLGGEVYQQLLRDAGAANPD